MVNGQVNETGGRKLIATESRFLLLRDSVTNPNHLWRGSVGVQKVACRWGVAGTGAAGTGAAGTGVAGTAAPQVVAPQPEEAQEEPSS